MKKFIFSFILIIGSFMFLNQKVNAAFATADIYNNSCTSPSWSSQSYSSSFGNSSSCSNNNSLLFSGYGQGTFVFSFYYEKVSASATSPIYSVSVRTRGDLTNYQEYVCNINNHTWYSDNNTQYQIITASCPVWIGAGDGLYGYRLYRNAGAGDVKTRISYTATFIPTDDTNVNVNVNQQQVVQAVQDSQQATISQIQSASSQAHQDAQQGNANTNDIKNNTKETNDLIKNDNIDFSSTSSNTSSWSNKNATNGVITQLLTLPITLLQAIVNGVQTSCTTFNLGTLWGTTLEMPCINLSSLIGSALFSIIDLLFSGFMIYAISKKLIKIFNDFTNLKSNQIDELYGGGNQ